MAGWRARGSDWASETDREQFERMSASFDKALADVDAALGRNPRLLYAFVIRIGIHNAEGEVAEEAAAFERARLMFPHSYMLYATMLNCTLPRWGGSYEQMERIASQAVQDNRGDERFQSLYGKVYTDQADGFERNGRLDEALDLHSKAIAYGEMGSALVARGQAYSRNGEPEKALADAERSLALMPEYVSAYLLRATIALKKGDSPGAKRDVGIAEALAPGDTEVDRWRKWAAERSGKTTR